MDCYKPMNDGFVTDLKNTQEVFSDCFDDSCQQLIQTENQDTRINNHKLIGEILLDENVLVKGNTIANTGWVKLPDNDFLNEDIYNNNKQLIENVNKKYEVYDKKYFSENMEIVTINNEFNIGDRVSVCLENTVYTDGIITDIDSSDYFIQLQDNESLKIKKLDKNVKISKKNLDNNNLCFSDYKDKFMVYLYDKEKLQNMDIEPYIHRIVPSFMQIFDNIKNKETFTSLKHFNEHFYRYGYNLNEITEKNFSFIKNIVNKNNKNKTPTQRIKKEYSETTIFQEKKNNFTLVNNFSLENLEHYYGRYPYYNTVFDTQNNRLAWLKNHSILVIFFSKI